MLDADKAKHNIHEVKDRALLVLRDRTNLVVTSATENSVQILTSKRYSTANPECSQDVYAVYVEFTHISQGAYDPRLGMMLREEDLPPGQEPPAGGNELKGARDARWAPLLPTIGVMFLSKKKSSSRSHGRTA